jgi:cell division protein FtsB
MPPFAYQRKTSQNRFVRVLRHRTISIVFLALGLVLLYFTFSAKGFYSRFVLHSDLHDQEQRVIELKRSISNLERERDLLRDDRLKIEHVARETHGMIKKGEIVYRIRPAETHSEQ